MQINWCPEHGPGCAEFLDAAYDVALVRKFRPMRKPRGMEYTNPSAGR